MEELTREALCRHCLRWEGRGAACGARSKGRQGPCGSSWRRPPHSWNGERVEAKEAGATDDPIEELPRRHLNVFEHRGEIRDRLPRGRKTTTEKIHRVTPPREACVNTSPWRFKARALLLVRQTPVAVVARWHDQRA